MFGVGNWDDKDDADRQQDLLREWQVRGEAFINPEYFFISPGSYSPPEYNPTTLPIHQIQFYRPWEYSRQNNYYRLGFQSGLYRSLQDFPDADLIIHYQCSRLIGRDLRSLLEEFMEREEQLLAPSFVSGCLEPSLDVGFMAMKPRAANFLVATGLRQNCDPDPNVMNCEEEVHTLLKDSWWNPWPEMTTTRQLDFPTRISNMELGTNFIPYDIESIDEYGNLPIIAIFLKHCSQTFYDYWLKKNPV